MEDLKHIIESLLFVAEDPLTIDKLRSILETVEAKEIRETLEALAREYDQRGGGFLLSEVAGGWQIRSRPEYHEWIKRMLQPSPQRLSKAALETLAIIAYKQPIIRADIEFIRGVDCGGVLRQLMERKLIRVLGRKEIAGRPLIYATTRLFLEMFDLKSLKDLPTPAELAEFGANLDIPPTSEVPQEDSTANQQLEKDLVTVQPEDEKHTGQEEAIEGDFRSQPDEAAADRADDPSQLSDMEDDARPAGGESSDSQASESRETEPASSDEREAFSRNDEPEAPKNT